jgi:hypothetical protein
MNRRNVLMLLHSGGYAPLTPEPAETQAPPRVAADEQTDDEGDGGGGGGASCFGSLWHAFAEWWARRRVLVAQRSVRLLRARAYEQRYTDSVTTLAQLDRFVQNDYNPHECPLALRVLTLQGVLNAAHAFPAQCYAFQLQYAADTFEKQYRRCAYHVTSPAVAAVATPHYMHVLAARLDDAQLRQSNPHKAVMQRALRHLCTNHQGAAVRLALAALAHTAENARVQEYAAFSPVFSTLCTLELPLEAFARRGSGGAPAAGGVSSGRVRKVLRSLAENLLPRARAELCARLSAGPHATDPPGVVFVWRVDVAPPDSGVVLYTLRSNDNPARALLFPNADADMEAQTFRELFEETYPQTPLMLTRLQCAFPQFACDVLRLLLDGHQFKGADLVVNAFGGAGASAEARGDIVWYQRPARLDHFSFSSLLAYVCYACDQHGGATANENFL